MNARPAFSIRHATAADVAACAEVHLNGWDSAYRDTPLHHHLDQHPTMHREAIWTKVLDRYDAGARLWIAALEAAIVGLVATGPARAPDRPAGAFELYALYQQRAVAGTGVAHNLVAHALADLRQRACRSIYLSVLASNVNARVFYERKGWASVAEVTMDYHGTPLDHVCYELQL
ncbi:MAG: GNAT family N-acetyltransferase [Myxococcota bacterium]|nr:GNAT family N-acetyltransferase [Myxococcota bacterium]